jgi:hypothetical protein
MPAQRPCSERTSLTTPAFAHGFGRAQVALASTLWLAGCAAPSAPQPPSLNLPTPVRDLTALRVGDSVGLAWTTPTHTTDKTAIKGAVTARVCRRIGNQPASHEVSHAPKADVHPACDAVADRPVTPGQRASFKDTLPAALATGAAQLLTYSIELRNAAGQGAGPSNSVWTASGSAPAPLEGFTASIRRDGVLLAWQPAPAGPNPAPAADDSVRIVRTSLSPPPPSSSARPLASEAPGRNHAPTPVEQVLTIRSRTGDQLRQALDQTAQFGQKYRYTAQRVRRLTLDTHPLAIEGVASSSVVVDVKDVFPPAVPTGLLAATDARAHAVDLSWIPDNDPELAGYFVYRRAADSPGSAGPERISGSRPVPAPGFRDSTGIPGQRYAYSVSAVDRSGNESARSAEVDEVIPR